jgi:tRNA (mo5U34)-methyltransferase
MSFPFSWKKNFNPRCTDKKRIRRSSILGSKYARYGATETIMKEVRDELQSYSFYHLIEIIPGLITDGWQGSQLYVQEVASVMRSYDLTGRSILDVGARDGALSIMAERAGAKRVVALDNDFSQSLRNFSVPFLNSNIECSEANIYEIDRAISGRFDFVICAGLVYHLHLPFLGLALLRDKLCTGGTLILETAILNEFEDLPVLLFATYDKSPYRDSTSPTFFNIECLREALEAHGFANVTVRRTFAEYKHPANEQFPKFVLKHPECKNISLMRAVITAQRIEKTGILYDYWEGMHSFHSAGGADVPGLDPGLVGRPAHE